MALSLEAPSLHQNCFSLLPAPIEVEPNVAVVADCRCHHINFIPTDFQVLMCGDAGFT